MVSGAGELRNLEEVCRNMKRPLNCVAIGVFPWGVLSDTEARRLVGHLLVVFVQTCRYVYFNFVQSSSVQVN